MVRSAGAASAPVITSSANLPNRFGNIRPVEIPEELQLPSERVAPTVKVDQDYGLNRRVGQGIRMNQATGQVSKSRFSTETTKDLNLGLGVDLGPGLGQGTEGRLGLGTGLTVGQITSQQQVTRQITEPTGGTGFGFGFPTGKIPSLPKVPAFKLPEVDMPKERKGKARSFTYYEKLYNIPSPREQIRRVLR
jgi:hypothetical protein